MSVIFSLHNEQMNLHHSIDQSPNPQEFKMHTHSDYELYYFINGSGTFYVEGNAYTLRAGDILLIKTTESHYIDIDPDLPYERLAIHFKKEFITSIDKSGELLYAFENRPAGKFNHFRRKDFENNTYLILVKNLLKETANRQLQVTTNFFALLNELKTASECKRQKNAPSDETLIHRVINYINDNLSAQITLDALCERFFISKAQLCKMFKKATGSTVWNYITTKRMIAAQKMIENGAAVTKVYSDLGYTDYSVFYRAYRDFFGHSPKTDSKKQNKNALSQA